MAAEETLTLVVTHDPERTSAETVASVLNALVGVQVDALTRDGLRVCAHECSTCIFRPGNLMRLQPGRVRSMVDGAVANDSFIPCHKTLDGVDARATVDPVHPPFTP